MITSDMLDAAQEQLERKRHQFLIERGWEYTSNTMGSIWLYRKTFEVIPFLPDKNLTYFCNQSTAIALEEGYTSLTQPETD